MASEKKVDESDASSQFKMAGRDNRCSDFSPSAASSQWVRRDHFQSVSVLCQLHLLIMHHLRPFSFCNFLLFISEGNLDGPNLMKALLESGSFHFLYPFYLSMKGFKVV